MSPLVALVVGLVLGGVVAVLLMQPVRRRVGEVVGGGQPSESALARRLLDLIDPAVVVLEAGDTVVLANPAARALGIVRGDRLVVPELARLAGEVRRGGSRRLDVRLPGLISPSGPRVVGVHGVRLESGTAPLPGPVALVLQDVTEARRTEAVRRDFVANVGHELKTPVGALALLAEAVQGASDDPETVERFASRMTQEADRLARLVRELIDLSRLQGAEPLPDLLPVSVDDVVAEAVDRTALAAGAKRIEVVVCRPTGLVVRGVEGQLAMALTNLIANAVAYSPEGTRIGVGVRARSGFAEIAVADRGIGIPREDRGRIFERFYRVDPSRAKRTGGTGLGLAIVKHVASNHGGSVTVESEEGIGSTFTLRIPLAPDDDGVVAGDTLSSEQSSGNGAEPAPADPAATPSRGRS